MRFFFSFITIFYLFWGTRAGAEERIVSLKPNLSEIVFDLGKGHELVGVTTYCDRPERARKIAKVADYIHTDTEKIMTLKPTLVLASRENSVEREIRFLENQGMKVALLSFARLTDMLGSVIEIGRLLNAAPKASEIVEGFQTQMKALAQRIPINKFSQKIIVIVGIKPLVVVGSNNLIDDALQALHLGNIYRSNKGHYPTINLEDLILKAPEVIIDLSMGSEEETKKKR